jgi:hypothetical protein
MASYTNFYENIKEAEMRLKNTVVLYDGEPYYVVNICDHKADGIFRVYLDPTGQKEGLSCSRFPGCPVGSSWDPNLGPTRGDAMDKWMELNPKNKILRKMMNSPSFNKFRPYPLGMVNKDGGVTYAERHPTRKTEQGLTNNMLVTNPVSVSGGAFKSSRHVDIISEELRETIINSYPSAQECLAALKDPRKANNAAAFHRNFAFARGPIGTIFLAYKQDVVGVLPGASLSHVRLGEEFKYTKEAIESLNLFGSITV